MKSFAKSNSFSIARARAVFIDMAMYLVASRRKPERANDLRLTGVLFILDQAKPALSRSAMTSSASLPSSIPAFI